MVVAVEVLVGVSLGGQNETVLVDSSLSGRGGGHDADSSGTVVVVVVLMAAPLREMARWEMARIRSSCPSEGQSSTRSKNVWLAEWYALRCVSLT